VEEQNHKMTPEQGSFRGTPPEIRRKLPNALPSDGRDQILESHKDADNPSTAGKRPGFEA
jgi:hypothetical protein